MRVQDEVDFTTLAWVKSELDETLKQANQALQAYVEDPTDSSLMQVCVNYLHQVQGTLRMVELYGAAMVLEEMEGVANALLDDSIKQRDEAYSVIMRGIVQLPDYLERLQSGHRDIPIVLLPLLNDLRACRGEKLLSESVLFSPDLTVDLPESVAGPESPMPDLELRALASRLRTSFQVGLLSWIRGNSVSESLLELAKVLGRLSAISTQVEARRLWWIAIGVLDAVRESGLETSVAIKLLIGRVDREIKRLIDSGEASFKITPPRDLVKNLLYYVAHSQPVAGTAQEIKQLYKLDNLLPSEKELAHAKGSLSGRNRSLLDAVSTAIKDDVLRVKDTLDIFLRTNDLKPAELSGQAEILDRVADTLGMLGLGVPRRVVMEQRQRLQSISTGGLPVDESALMDIAAALLYVEDTLEENIQSLGFAVSSESDEADPSLLPSVEIRRILDALMKEAHSNLSQAKQDIVAFVESPWDHDKVHGIPKLLDEISGALKMLDLKQSADLVSALSRFVEIELITNQRVPSEEQMDRLADALASVEYYLEATQAQGGGRERILAVTQRSLESLGYWPLPESAAQHVSSSVELEEDAQPTNSTEWVAAEDGALRNVDSLSFNVEVTTNQSALAELHAQGMELPTFELEDDGLEESLNRLERREQSSPSELSEEPSDLDANIDLNLDVAVDVLPGNDIADLLVGKNEPVTSPRAVHDVDGLVLAPTLTAAQLALLDESDFEWVDINTDVNLENDGALSHASSAFTNPSDEIDDDIREIFIDEVGQEINNLRRLVPQWRANLQDIETLKIIRRAYHTMKGSGRLVGAVALGEISWRIENALNRVIDNSIQANLAIVDLLEHANRVLPEFVEALKTGAAVKAPIATIHAVADKLAQGESVWLVKSGNDFVMRSVSRVKALKQSAPEDEVVVDSVELTEVVNLDLTEKTVPESENADIDDVSGAMFGGSPQHVYESNVQRIDPLLLEILRAEVSGHLRSVRDYLAQKDELGAAIPATQSLIRAVHTMHGAVSMVEVPVIDVLVGPLEGYIKRLRGAGLAPDSKGVFAISDSADLIEQVLAVLDQDDDQLPSAGQLFEQLQELKNSLPEVSDPMSVYNLEGEFADEDNEDIDGLFVDLDGSTSVSDSAPMVAEKPASADVVGTSSDELADAIEDLSAEKSAEIVSSQHQQSETDANDDLSYSSVLGADLTELEEEIVIAEDSLFIEEPEVIAESIELVSDLNDDFEWSSEEASALIPDVGIDPSSSSQSEISTAGIEITTDALDWSAPIDAVIENTLDSTPQSPLSELPDLGSVEFSEPSITEDEPSAPTHNRIEENDKRNQGRASSNIEPIEEDLHPDLPLGLPDADDDLINIFVEEGEEILDESDSLVATLRDSSSPHEGVLGLLRHLHTLKGNARAVDIPAIGDLTHAMESMLEAVSVDQIGLDRGGIEALEAGYDRLHVMIRRVDQRLSLAMPVNIIARFSLLAAGGMPAERAAEIDPKDFNRTEFAANTQPLAKPEPIREVADAQPGGWLASLAPLAELTAPEEPAATRGSQEVVRVRSDLLDSLVNYAGEVSIYRSRLEQQVGSFRFNLVELDQTVSRLREQLRKLEIETEAQIIARFQRETVEGTSNFDPLELDRFSTLQQLSRALAESVSDLVSLQALLDDLTRQAETLLLQQSRVSSELQEGLMRTRMVPFDSIVPFLRRLLRQTATDLGKRALLSVVGAEGEMDRNLLDRMKAPFEHMLRNAMAHGLESPVERRKLGKPEEGSVRIAVSREGTEVVLKVSDDGEGLDRDAIRRKAIQRGLMKPDAELSDRDLFGFILETGFSTAEQVTQISGRGVGMDVVNSEIKQLGGTLSIESQRGVGTTFTVRLPFTLAVTQAIMVRTGESVFAVPMTSVQGVARISPTDYARRLASGEPSLSYAGEEYAIYELTSLLSMPAVRNIDNTAQLPLLITRTGDQRAAIRIDAVMSSREIVVKPVGPQISALQGIFGATIMGDGTVIMILDLAPLVRRFAAGRADSSVEDQLDALMPGSQPGLISREEIQTASVKLKAPLIMVVDDSITMRKVTSRVLERHDMDVVTAKDGLDAIEKFAERLPDLILLDIEMPRMDGYELATYMRNDSRLKSVPIIMITSRTGEKHRQRAFEIGVDRYLGKPYQEVDLMSNVEEVLRATRAR